MKKMALVLVALIVILPSSLWADDAITLGTYSNFTNGAWTLGFEFTPTVNINVTALGSYFQGAGPTGAFQANVTTSHDVGMWDTSGNLLAMTTVVGSGAGTDGFQYAAIPTLTLLAGNSYIVGGETLSDNYAIDVNKTFVVGPYLSYIIHLESYGAALQNPQNGYTTLDDWGGTFQYTATPEPGTLVLFGTGLIGAAGAIRRRLSL